MIGLNRDSIHSDSSGPDSILDLIPGNTFELNVDILVHTHRIKPCRCDKSMMLIQTFFTFPFIILLIDHVAKIRFKGRKGRLMLNMTS
jgi:hypothetical protein